MTDIQMRGLRLWISSAVHWPSKQIREKIDETEHKFEDMKENIQAELERRARNFERNAVAWAATALLLAIAGFLIVLGLWLWFAQQLGSVEASFLLAAVFIALAPIPVFALRKIFPDPESKKPVAD